MGVCISTRPRDKRIFFALPPELLRRVGEAVGRTGVVVATAGAGTTSRCMLFVRRVERTRLSTSRPRRRRNSSPRTIHVAAVAATRRTIHVAAVAATRPEQAVASCKSLDASVARAFRDGVDDAERARPFARGLTTRDAARTLRDVHGLGDADLASRWAMGVRLVESTQSFEYRRQCQNLLSRSYSGRRNIHVAAAASLRPDSQVRHPVRRAPARGGRGPRRRDGTIPERDGVAAPDCVCEGYGLRR